MADRPPTRAPVAQGGRILSAGVSATMLLGLMAWMGASADDSGSAPPAPVPPSITVAEPPPTITSSVPSPAAQAPPPTVITSIASVTSAPAPAPTLAPPEPPAPAPAPAADATTEPSS